MAVTLEEIIEQIGGCGRFQITMVAFVHFCKTVLVLTLLFMMIGAVVPDWWCVDDFQDTNSTRSVFMTNSSSYKSCFARNGTKPCTNIIFDTSARSIVSEWGLVCDKQWIVSTITSVQMAGLFVGNTVGGHVADAVGRKPTFYVAIASMVVFNVVAIFSSSWMMFAVIRFILGVACGFQLTVQYTIQCEFTLARWRSFVVNVPSWQVILLLYTLIGWLLRDWRHIHIVTVAFGVASLATCCFVQESFRWKVAHNRTEDAYKIVKFIAKVNRAADPDKQDLADVAENVQSEGKRLKDRKFTLVDLIRTRQLLKYTGPLMVIWFSMGLSVYGIQFAVHALAGEFYLNLLIYSVLSILGALVVIYLQNRFGRKQCLAGLLIVSTITAAAVGMAYRFKASPTRDMVSRLCAIVSVTALNVAFAVMQTLTLEMYPTVVRNIAYGVQNTMARLGAVIGPQLVLLDRVMPGLMYFICAFVGIMSILSLRPLPETKSAALQDRLPKKHVRHEEQALGSLNQAPQTPALLAPSKELEL